MFQYKTKFFCLAFFRIFSDSLPFHYLLRDECRIWSISLPQKGQVGVLTPIPLSNLFCFCRYFPFLVINFQVLRRYLFLLFSTLCGELISPGIGATGPSPSPGCNQDGCKTVYTNWRDALELDFHRLHWFLMLALKSRKPGNFYRLHSGIFA